MMFNFGKTTKHRVFNYQPLYYDERKEILNDKIEKARREASGDYKPGDLLRSSFRMRGKIEVKKSDGHNKARRIITLVTLVALMGSLVYLAEYMGLLFN